MGIQHIAVLLVIALLVAPARSQEGLARRDRFAQLRFLAGTWRGDQAGQPGRGTAERTYTFILNDRFLQETNTSTYPPQEKNKNGEIHHHMSMIGYDAARKLFVFRQFHSEGFVNTYLQQPASDEKTIVFVSEAIENIPLGYRARETYTILSRDEFTERLKSQNRARTSSCTQRPVSSGFASGQQAAKIEIGMAASETAGLPGAASSAATRVNIDRPHPRLLSCGQLETGRLNHVLHAASWMHERAE